MGIVNIKGVYSGYVTIKRPRPYLKDKNRLNRVMMMIICYPAVAWGRNRAAPRRPEVLHEGLNRVKTEGRDESILGIPRSPNKA